MKSDVDRVQILPWVWWWYYGQIESACRGQSLDVPIVGSPLWDSQVCNTYGSIDCQCASELDIERWLLPSTSTFNISTSVRHSSPDTSVYEVYKWIYVHMPVYESLLCSCPFRSRLFSAVIVKLNYYHINIVTRCQKTSSQRTPDVPAFDLRT